MINLNHVHIPDDSVKGAGYRLSDPTTEVQIVAHFRNLEQKIQQYIAEDDMQDLARALAAVQKQGKE